MKSFSWATKNATIQIINNLFGYFGLYANTNWKNNMRIDSSEVLHIF